MIEIRPDFKEFEKLSRKGNVVPVFFEFPADLDTPVSVFLKIAAKQKNAFLLESVELGEQLGRFSFIGIDPDLILQKNLGHSYLYKNGKKTRLVSNKSFLDHLESEIRQFKLVPNELLPPMAGGFVGYIGYEMVQDFEDIKLKNKKGISIPDSTFIFAKNLVVFDHIKHHLKVIHFAEVKANPKAAYKNALKHLGKLLKELKTPLKIDSEIRTNHKPLSLDSFKSNMSQAQFKSIVNRVKSYIKAGDIIQAVVSQRFDAGKIKDAFRLYRVLRSLNPSPYMFYFHFGDYTLVGSSPELLTRKKGMIAEVKPIAGTRPRGEDAKQDSNFENQLKASVKELAEHLMLVDLGRNDLGRVSEQKSVVVNNFAHVERYSHVMHLVSDVESKLKKGTSAFDLIKATFPAGTVSGAPKIRAMQIIDELESEKRGPYAGSLGYFSLTGDMDMCITIRTIMIEKGHAYIQAGAGIVNDSNPEKEYQETVNKAKALFHAVEQCR